MEASILQKGYGCPRKNLSTKSVTLKEDSQKFALPEKSLDDVIFDLFKRNELDNFICLILLLSGLGQGVGSKFLKTLVTLLYFLHHLLVVPIIIKKC